MTNEALVEIQDITKHFHSGSRLWGKTRRVVRALDGISLTIYRQETLGVVGETGCGKTTLGRALLRLIEPDQGKVFFEGKDILSMPPHILRKQRQHMQMVFQNPYSSFDPHFSIDMSLSEPFKTHASLNVKERKQAVQDLLSQVGMAADVLTRYPHEFSGGQLQRIATARALALNPLLLILDEPTSALDVSVQAQILNLLLTLQIEHHLTYLLITHDLSVVSYLCDRVAVMYLGKVVELIHADKLARGNACHPYTLALMASIPKVTGKDNSQRTFLPLRMGDPTCATRECNFYPRCPRAITRCEGEEPPLREIQAGHWVACHVV